MDDKYMVYIFSVFLAREYEEAVNILIENLQNNMVQLFSSRFFKFLLYRIQQKIHSRKVLSIAYQEIAAFLKQISKIEWWKGELDADKEARAMAVDPLDAAFLIKLVPTSVLYEKLELQVIDMLFNRLLDLKDPQQQVTRRKKSARS